jgi:hypothetical protein
MSSALKCSSSGSAHPACANSAIQTMSWVDELLVHFRRAAGRRQLGVGDVHGVLRAVVLLDHLIHRILGEEFRAGKSDLGLRLGIKALRQGEGARCGRAGHRCCAQKKIAPAKAGIRRLRAGFCLPGHVFLRSSHFTRDPCGSVHEFAVVCVFMRI